MKNCTDCKWAKWQRTKAGKLHPSGQGECTKNFIPPVLPAAFFWSSFINAPCGGLINRRQDHDDHCPYYEAT